LYKNLINLLQNLPNWLVNALAGLIVILIGLIDAVSGKEISFSILYLVPVAFVTWYSGRTSGIIIAALSVGAWLTADAVSGIVYSSNFIHIWNGISRFGIYLVIIFLETALKEKYKSLELDIEEKEADLSIEKMEHKKTFESVKRLSLFPELNPNPIIEIDNRKSLTYLNDAADKFLNRLDGIFDYTVFLPDDIDNIINDLADKNKLVVYREKKIGEIILEEYIYLIHTSKVIQIYAADITARKIAEENIKRSLKEKEILLKEIHHRVKNNLQIISSLLKLQSAFIKDQNDLSVFMESQNRISSIASIHKMLYESEDISNINAGIFFSQLTNKLFHIYNTDVTKIKTVITAENVNIDTDIANPLGLLLTEIVSNSLKYAFINKNEGIINITFKKDKGNKYSLEIGDNGIGISKDVDYNQSPTLGLQLIDLLSRQLNAAYHRDVSSGTNYVFKFERAE
jgi:two-component sensor histidine kinase